MSRLSISTPCPAYSNLTVSSIKDVDDTTATLNFTSAFGPSSWKAPPKRKQRHSAQFAIHEDEQPASVQPGRTALSQPAKRSVIGQPHDKVQSPTNLENGLEVSVHRRRSSLASSRLAQAPRRPTARLSVVSENTIHEDVDSQKEETTTIARPARRRTIYIPNEDTTMPSMYMGIFSPINNQDWSGQGDAQPTIDVTSIAARMAVKKGSRKSIIGAAPRRGPLRMSTGPLQESTIVIDRVGQGGGKENFPPGYTEAVKKTEVVISKPSSINTGTIAAHRMNSRTDVLQGTRPAQRPGVPLVSKISTRSSPPIKPATTDFERSRPAWNGGPRPRAVQAPPPKIKQTTPVYAKPVVEDAAPQSRAPSRFLIPTVKTQSVQTSHPLLSDDILASSMYNDNWLEDQEIAITQLINKIFVCARPDTIEYVRSKTLTQQLLPLYNSNGMKLMYSRLQAAIQYGSLSVPQDALDSAEGLVKDVGRKQRYLELWLHNYNHDALVAALEVVTGRVCRSVNQRRSGDKVAFGAVPKKMIQTFLETFLLCNEDGRPDKEAESRATWSYRRTLLRSLLLIKALDIVKTDRLVHFTSCLFLPPAPCKSSIEVLQTLVQMLNPAIGDPVRALGYIDYTITHVQFPLEEFTYDIANLAVDLRDGVRLTRLVELLLYPSASATLQKTFDADATTTISLPAGESFDFSDGQDWPLSQHLKLPCPSRAAKLWNVQVALSAVRNVKGMSVLVEDINAEDIVDGFREKTIKLLWALVGKCGLTSLIDWKDVAWECRRLEPQVATDIELELDGVDHDEGEDFYGTASFGSCKSALKNWARLVAATKNVTVTNFTTSFSDGKVFKAIIDHYEPLLVSSPTSIDPALSRISTSASISTSAHSTLSLSDRLIALGCSKQFANLFPSSPSSSSSSNTTTTNRVTTHTFDRDFVLATLTFLCSRLLAPSRGVRAALVIQTAWRTYRARIENVRRKQRQQVASACARAVQAKSKMNNDLLTAAEGAEIISPVKQGDVDFWVGL